MTSAQLHSLWWVFVLVLVAACSERQAEQLSPLEQALQSDHPAISQVMENLAAHELQIIYTQIDGLDATPQFQDFTFQLDDNRYFYPASTVKLPTAVLALEWLDQRAHINAQSWYAMDGDNTARSVADDVRQIFSVSDDDAYNRLYELLGRDYINRQLARRGLSQTRIAHRVGTEQASAAQRRPMLFLPRSGKELVVDNARADDNVLALKIEGLRKGKGYWQADELISKPMNFALKNHFPLREQHELIKRLFFPANFSADQHFDLSLESRALLRQAMHLVPREQGYAEEEYSDSYGKFFIYGDSDERIPEHMQIYNKVGWAYGTLTETAYIVDLQRGSRFLLSATILVNANGVFNDDTYEYENVGVPFLAQLGRELLTYEEIRGKR